MLVPYAFSRGAEYSCIHIVYEYSTGLQEVYTFVFLIYLVVEHCGRVVETNVLVHMVMG